MLLLLTVNVKVMSQQANTVSGIVTDAKTGETIPGVNIQLKGSKQYGTSTDIDGKYTINVSSIQNGVLAFSFVGYKDIEVPINNNTVVNVALESDTESLDEVVVVAYGTQRKVNLTGAVSTVGAAKIENRPVTNVSSSLAGLSSGVSVRQSSGQPGSDGATIRIRGNGTLNSDYMSPMVIVDGIPGVMDAVNPNDIESISVLKDAASAAIYGSQAANGVILITTKKGKKGKPTVSYVGLYSIARPTNIYEYVSDYAWHMRLQNEASTNVGGKIIFDPSTISAWEDASKNPNGISQWGVPNSLAYPNTNWGDEIFETNLIQNHDVSVMGGNENTTYSMSLGYLNNPGIMQVTTLNRYQARVNIETRISKAIRVGTQTFGSIQDVELGNISSAFNYLRQSTPGITPYHDGRFGGPEAAEESATANNPIWFLNSSGGKGITNRINTSWYTIVDIWDGLGFEGRFNYQQRTYDSKSYTVPYNLYSFRTNEVVRTGSTPDNINVTNSFNKNWSYMAQALLRYQKTFGKNHDVTGLLGFEQYYYKYYNFDATKKGVIDPSIVTLGSMSEMVSINGGEQEKAMRSLFGRVTYGYKGKYLFEGNFRYDGSSYFVGDNQWGFFPSVSGAWRISEEGFMNDLKSVISNMKIRASWGQLGNVTSGPYDPQASYSKVNYSFNGKESTGLRQNKLANPNLRWEQTNNTNIGFDVSFLSNQLNVEFDWYNRITDRILTSPPIPITMGIVGAPTRNTASMVNRGIEISIGWKSTIGSDFTYSVQGNFAYNYNRVTNYKGKFSEGWATDADGKSTWQTNIGQVASQSGNTVILEDYMMGEYYLRNLYNGDGSYFNSDGTVNINGGPKDGMIRTEKDMEWVNAMKSAGYSFSPTNTVNNQNLWYGEFIYADVNGDKVYGNTNDRVFTGKSSNPKFVYGLNVSMAWKGIDFSMQWAGNAGVYYYWWDGNNNTSTKNGNAINLAVAKDHYFYDFSNPNNPANNINGKYPRLKGEERDAATVPSTWNLYNASFLRLKNLQIGYTIPPSITSKVYISNLRVFVSAENLWTITSFPGLDPEIGSGITYPTLKQFAFGINLSF